MADLYPLPILSQHLLFIYFLPASLRQFSSTDVCLSAKIQPKGSKDPSLSVNYHGIPLASSLSKIVEWSILLTWGILLQVICSLGLSLVTQLLCTGVMKAVITCYLNSGSRVYACTIDASKAFWYGQPLQWQVTNKWDAQTSNTLAIMVVQVSTSVCQVDDCRSSSYSQVSNGVWQGGVLSPILFTIYMDSLLDSLMASGRGCFGNTHFAAMQMIWPSLFHPLMLLGKWLSNVNHLPSFMGSMQPKPNWSAFSNHSVSVSSSYHLLTLATYCVLVANCVVSFIYQSI